MAVTLLRIIYTLILAIASPILLWGLYQAKPNKPKFGTRWKEHFGFTPELSERKSGIIWLHAVSVGEVLASKALIENLKEQYSDKTILVTTTTSTGAEQVTKFADGIEHRYMPIDISWCVKRFLRIVRPELFIIVETELWPNTIHCVAERNTPIILVNGRLSEKSGSNYTKLRWLIAPTLNKIQRILTVHKDDKSRFNLLVSNDERVQVTGSIKYDVNIDEKTRNMGNVLRLDLGRERKVWIAASTHLGEDEQILQAYRLAKKNIPELLLVLVPRHPERFNNVATMIQDRGLKLARRTEYSQSVDSDIDVYLGDTMGEMMVLMAASDLVFMGGSLLGRKVGGHNFIEPALLSKPCLTGPSYYNFSDLASQLISNDALKVVCTAVELSEELEILFSEPKELISMGDSGHDIVLKNQGALQRTLDAIHQVILKSLL